MPGDPLSASALRLSPAVVPALALPLLFLHVKWQPTFAVGSSLTVSLSDLAVAAVVAAALVEGARTRFEPLRHGVVLWVVAAALLVWIAVAIGRGHMLSPDYPVKTHLVTAAKFAEYALLAPALPLLLRRRSDLSLFLAALVAWSCAATLVGLLQFGGLNIVNAWPPGWRQPSFLGVHDFGALSAAALCVAAAARFLGSEPRPVVVAGAVSGLLGLLLTGAVAITIGILLALGALAFVAWRRDALARPRAVAVGAVALVVVVGTVVLRGNDLSQYVRFLGLKQAEHSTTNRVQTYAQRTLLTYIGLRIFLDHPILGAGWHASTDQWAYAPYLQDAHRRFPNASPLSFPTPAHPYGLQSAYVEAPADMGIVGLVVFVGLLVATCAAGAAVALRGPPRALLPATVGLAWMLVAVGAWTGVDLVAGSPLDALTWLAVGLVAVGRAWTAKEAV